MRQIPLLALSIAFLLAALCRGGEEPRRNPKLLAQEPGQWVKLHEQKAGDAVRFARQEHGGSCFDTKRGRLVLFGSNTHSKDWHNSPLIFDPVECAWSRVYPDDPVATYKVTEDGLPVCGERGDHPWTSHTFGAVMYDPERDEMLVCCFDDHLAPNKWGSAVAHLWPQIKRKPTWTYRFETGEWKALPGSGVSFFPHSAAWDSDRKCVVGHRSEALWELSGEPRAWKKIAEKGFFGWHNNCAYDAKHKALVVVGSNENSNDVGVYFAATKEAKKMPTPGERPPKDQHNPMEYHPKIERTVVLVDRETEPAAGGKKAKFQTETWLYDLGADAWTRVESATLPFGCGMNFNMEYDPGHEALLLVTGGYSGPTSVWALKLTPESAAKPAEKKAGE